METGEECAPLESTLFLDFVQRRVCLQVDNCAQVGRKLFPQQESTCSIDASHFASTTWKQLNPHSRCLVETIHALSQRKLASNGSELMPPQTWQPPGMWWPHLESFLGAFCCSVLASAAYGGL